MRVRTLNPKRKVMMFKQLKRTCGLPRLGAVLLGCLLPLSAVFAQAVGKVERVQGVARISGNQGEREARVQGAVEEGDRIYTERGAEVVMRMKDGAVIAVRPSSSIEITTYQYDKSNNDSSVVNLLRGALRKVTGLIAKNNRENVTVRTATATIGVRGTDFEAVFIDEESRAETQSGGGKADELGTYSKVYTGGTFLESEGKRVDVAVGQVGYVPLDPLKVALQMGLIRNLPNSYKGGRFDNVIPNLFNGALPDLRNLNVPGQGILNSIPKAPNGNNNMPDLQGLIPRR
jgi:hypothetical protein